MCYMSDQTTVGVRELRQNLSVYLRRVEEGETLRVTDRGRQVAVLSPLPENMTALDRLIASGRARPATGSLAELGPPPPAPRGLSITRALEEQRDDRALGG